MNQQEWLDWRREGIGASDAGIIMGVAPKHWGTPYTLWEEKVYGTTKEDNAAMKYGRDNEESARRCFEKMIGVSVFPVRKEHPRLTWARATLDGLDIDGKVMVEIKCPNKADHIVALNKKVPEKYYPQCQHQLLVTELDHMYYFSYDGSDGVTVEVARDNEYIQQMVDAEYAFWQLVVNKTPPEQDFLDMAGNHTWENFDFKMYEERHALIKALKADEKRDTLLLSQASQDRSSQGYGFKLTKTVCKGQIDYEEAIVDYLANQRAHYPEINLPDIPLEPYRKDPFTKWSMRRI